MDTALIFAGASFVGRHLGRHLISCGVNVEATSRAPRPGLLNCDLADPAQIEHVLRSTNPRWIFQCAGATSQASPDELHALHEGAAQSLLDAVRRIVPEAVVVLFGSAAEYGPVPPELLPIHENVPAAPTSAYGRSKLAQLRVAERFALDFGLRVHVVRPFNLLGPGLGQHYFAAALCERLRKLKEGGHSGPVPINNAHATRDWVDGRDAAVAVARLALHAPPPPGSLGLFNIASEKETAILDLATVLCQLAGDFEAVPGERTQSRSDIDRSCGSNQRLREAAGWTPRIDWRESLRDMWMDR